MACEWKSTKPLLNKAQFMKLYDFQDRMLRQIHTIFLFKGINVGYLVGPFRYSTLFLNFDSCSYF